MFELVISPEILDEIRCALVHEKLRKFRWMTEEQIAELLHVLAQAGVLVSGRAKIKASRDPDDDKFRVAAVEAGARFVVPGDRDLYAHTWRVGDLVMWDNRQTMHRARPFPAHEPARHAAHHARRRRADGGAGRLTKAFRDRRG